MDPVETVAATTPPTADAPAKPKRTRRKSPRCHAKAEVIDGRHAVVVETSHSLSAGEMAVLFLVAVGPDAKEPKHKTEVIEAIKPLLVTHGKNWMQLPPVQSPIAGEIVVQISNLFGFPQEAAGNPPSEVAKTEG